MEWMNACLNIQIRLNRKNDKIEVFDAFNLNQSYQQNAAFDFRQISWAARNIF